MATVNDVVLIYLEDAPVSFARVESILPDAKKDWYHIKLLMLQIPLQVVTWILKDDYINGHQFNMNGKPMRIEKVECPVEELALSNLKKPSSKEKSEKDNPKKKKAAKIISFSDLKKNDGPESG
ncbi:MAG: hypothetical protein GY699_20155 [Desulfobacteraceae bacterium]|nr:hypothetical protein [Desulfobacteraceae bacterium]